MTNALQGHEARNFRGWWHWCLSNRLLWFTNLRSLGWSLRKFFKPYTTVAGFQPPKRQNLLKGKPSSAAKVRRLRYSKHTNAGRL